MRDVDSWRLETNVYLPIQGADFGPKEYSHPSVTQFLGFTYGILGQLQELWWPLYSHVIKTTPFQSGWWCPHNCIEGRPPSVIHSLVLPKTMCSGPKGQTAGRGHQREGVAGESVKGLMGLPTSSFHERTSTGPSLLKVSGGISQLLWLRW